MQRGAARIRGASKSTREGWSDWRDGGAGGSSGRGEVEPAGWEVSVGGWEAQGAKNNQVRLGGGYKKCRPRFGVSGWVFPALGLWSEHAQVFSRTSSDELN